MKINNILIGLLALQLIALLARNGGGYDARASRTIASVSDQSLTLDPQRGGEGLKDWLARHELDPDQPASSLGVGADELKSALRRAELDREMSSELEAAVASLKATRITLAEGPEEEVEGEISPAEAKARAERPTYIAFQREGDQWLIESAQGYPAGNEKARGLLKNILGASLGTVIATRAAHHTKLRVSELKHDRKITFSLNGSVQV